MTGGKAGGAVGHETTALAGAVTVIEGRRVEIRTAFPFKLVVSPVVLGGQVEKRFVKRAFFRQHVFERTAMPGIGVERNSWDRVQGGTFRAPDHAPGCQQGIGQPLPDARPAYGQSGGAQALNISVNDPDGVPA